MEGLLLKTQAQTLLAQFGRVEIDFESSEPNDLGDCPGGATGSVLVQMSVPPAPALGAVTGRDPSSFSYLARGIHFAAGSSAAIQARATSA